MAKRKPAAAEAVQLAPDAGTAPQLPEIVPPQSPEAPSSAAQQPEAGQPPRQWRANPYPIKTVNLDGYKLQLQESRHEGQPWQMQIKFGSGGKDEMPSDAVRDFIKSHKLDVVTKGGEAKQIQLFHWNDKDRAWGMAIDFNAPATSRQKAAEVFKKTVELIAEERGVSQQR